MWSVERISECVWTWWMRMRVWCCRSILRERWIQTTKVSEGGFLYVIGSFFLKKLKDTCSNTLSYLYIFCTKLFTLLHISYQGKRLRCWDSRYIGSLCGTDMVHCWSSSPSVVAFIAWKGITGWAGATVVTDKFFTLRIISRTFRKTCNFSVILLYI